MRLSQSHLVSQSHLISQLGNLSLSFSFFSLRSDCKELDFKDISYLVIVLYQEHKILPSSGQCKECETQLNMEHFEFRPSTNYAFWRCPLCRSKKSLRDGTHLSGVKITLRTYILLCYILTNMNGLTYTQIQSELRVPSSSNKYGFESDHLISERTLSKFLSYFRSIICESMLETNKFNKIGGPGR